MKEFLIRWGSIGFAGAGGAILRVVIQQLFTRLNIIFPLATFIINISGSMFLGWFVAYALARHVPFNTRLAIGGGFVGAYTTFSTYMVDSNDLFSRGAYLLAALNLFGSLVCGLIAVRLGILMAPAQ